MFWCNHFRYRSIPSKIIAKIRSFNGPENSVKNAKNMPCSLRLKNDVISMTRKLKSETSSQKIDVSADIIFGSLTLQSDFVILDLNVTHMAIS